MANVRMFRMLTITRPMCIRLKTGMHYNIATFLLHLKTFINIDNLPISLTSYKELHDAVFFFRDPHPIVTLRNAGLYTPLTLRSF